MSKLFIIQLIVSFIVGGSIIALLSLAAEKVNKTIAGILIAFPSTVALGFFFLGWNAINVSSFIYFCSINYSLALWGIKYISNDAKNSCWFAVSIGLYNYCDV